MGALFPNLMCRIFTHFMSATKIFLRNVLLPTLLITGLQPGLQAQFSNIPRTILWDTLTYPSTQYGWKEGMEVPNLYLLDIHLNPLELDDLLSEKPVLLDFWFTACPPCRENNPLLKKIHRKGKVHILSISIDEKLTTLKAFIKKEQLSWQHIQDNHPYPNRFKNRIGLGNYYPDYLLIGRDGTLIQRWQGEIKMDEFKRALKLSP